MLTQERQFKAVEWRALCVGARDDCEGCVLTGGGFGDHSQSFGGVGGSENRDARFYYASFLGCDARESRTEPLLMVVLDVRDHAGEGGDDVCGIQPAAKAGFPHNEIAFFGGEPGQRHYGNDFKEGGM